MTTDAPRAPCDPVRSHLRHVPLIVAAAIIVMLACVSDAAAAMIEVTVTGIPNDRGVVACSLHDDPAGFPMSGSIVQNRGLPRSGQAVCWFDDVVPGRYAIAVLHDANANGRMDTNVLGMPQESWGISVSPAPRLRPPRFDEAAFDVGTAPVRLMIGLSP